MEATKKTTTLSSLFGTLMVLLVSTDQSFASDDFDEKVESEFEERLSELDK